MIGHLLGSRYELRRMLGRGGIGQVWEAWDTRFGQLVAVKLLDKEVAGNPALVAQFTRDVRASARVAHPNIAAIRGLGHDGDRHFMVTELVEGRSVAELLGDGPLPPEQAAAIAADVCLALEQAHQRGVAHLDLKPANILVTSSGEIKVTDFGIAKVGVAPGGAGGTAIVGTAEYLAPEQAAGRYVDGRADFYALGGCLYEMLTGRPPFGRVGEPHGDGVLTALAIASRHLGEAPVPPHRLQAGVPAALDRVVLRALAKQPDARHQTAEEFRRDLHRFSRRTTTAAPPAGGEIDDGMPAEGVEASGGSARRRATGSTEVVLLRSAPASPVASIPAPSGPAPVAMAGGAHAAPASSRSAGEPLALRGAPAEAEAPARMRRTAPATRRPARRRYAWLAVLAALLLAVGGAISAFSASGSKKDGNDTALLPQPGLEAVPPPTTLTVTSTTEGSTTESTATTTTAASTTSLATTTSAAGQAAAADVVVANVVGNDVDEAAAKLAGQGLHTRVRTVVVRGRPREGEVLEQAPAAGTRVPPGTTVTLTVGTRSDRAATG